jgi:hypothetical protein
VKHVVGLESLIERNKKEELPPKNEVINFPFILLSTKNQRDNEIQLNFSNDKRKLDICVKQPVDLMGDMDALIELGMHQVEPQLAEQHFEGAAKILA